MMFKIILNCTSLLILLRCLECYKNINISCLQEVYIRRMLFLVMLFAFAYALHYRFWCYWPMMNHNGTLSYHLYVHIGIFRPSYVQNIPFKTQYRRSHVLHHKNETRSKSIPVWYTVNLLQPATLVARPLLTPVARKLWRCKHGVFATRTCVHSRTLLRIEIVCCCLWSI
jgi:hypothetical protein